MSSVYSLRSQTVYLQYFSGKKYVYVASLAWFFWVINTIDFISKNTYKNFKAIENFSLSYNFYIIMRFPSYQYQNIREKCQLVRSTIIEPIPISRLIVEDCRTNLIRAGISLAVYNTLATRSWPRQRISKSSNSRSKSHCFCTGFLLGNEMRSRVVVVSTIQRKKKKTRNGWVLCLSDWIMDLKKIVSLLFFLNHNSRRIYFFFRVILVKSFLCVIELFHNINFNSRQKNFWNDPRY